MELFEKVQGISKVATLSANSLTYSTHSLFRVFPLDMAGFAVHLCQLFKHPKARVGVNIHGQTSKNGFLETDFLQHFANKSTVECRGSETEVIRVFLRVSIRKIFHREKLFCMAPDVNPVKI